jgi:hypothetical protein
MDPNHRTWNNQQHLLQSALSHPEKHPEWLALFLSQHAQVHSGRITDGKYWSFEDEVLGEMDDGALRSIPTSSEHSLAWILWHLARIEDVTMNLLVAGTSQIFDRQGWMDKVNAPIFDTGNEIDSQQVLQFNQQVDLKQLKAYREAVGLCTRQVVSRLNPDVLKAKVSPERILQVRRSGAVVSAAQGIVDYWSRRTVAGLLLMPPTRHCFLHLNEALRIKHALLG